MPLQSINDDLLDIGIKALTDFTGDGRPRMVRRVQCGCGAHAEMKFRPTDSPDWVIREFVKKGWKVGRKGGTQFCPTCSEHYHGKVELDDEIKAAMRSLREQGHSTREIASMLGVSQEPVARYLRSPEAKAALKPQADVRQETAQPTPIPEPASEPEPLPPPEQEPEPSPSILAISQICDTLSFLNRYFHDGRYAQGWSDERIASVLELFPEQVAQVRLESRDHGPIKPSPEVEALKAEIATLEQLFVEQVSELRARLAPLEAVG